MPDHVSVLRNLKKLDLSGNYLTIFPEAILELTELTKLYLSNNQLHTLPKSLRKLAKLVTLNLISNPELESVNIYSLPSRLRVLFIEKRKLLGDVGRIPNLRIEEETAT